MSNKRELNHDIRYFCYCCSDNYVNSVIELIYTYWLNKVTILEDPGNLLKPIFKMLNFKTMENGLMNLVLDYGFGLTIGKPFFVWYDKNDLPLACETQVKIIGPTRGAFKVIKVVDWKVFDERYTPKVLKEEIIKKLGWGNYKVQYDGKGRPQYDKKNNLIKKFVINNNVFKGIFLKNNIKEDPILTPIEKILQNVHDTDKKADVNRDTINVNYSVKSNRKLDKNQINNFSTSIDCDGRVINLNSIEDDKSDSSYNNFIGKTDFVTSSLNRWSEIQPELEKWVEDAYFFSGISKEKLSVQRENLPETIARTYTVSTLEKAYFDPRETFVNEYNAYQQLSDNYKGDVVIEFDAVEKSIESVRMMGIADGATKVPGNLNGETEI